MIDQDKCCITNLPVLGLTGKHHRVLIFRDIIILLSLSLLDVVLGLNALILGESTVVTRLKGGQF